VAKAKARLAVALEAGGSSGEAERLLHQAIDTIDALFGSTHMEAVRDTLSLVRLLLDQRRFYEAEELSSDGVSRARAGTHWEMLTDLSLSLSTALEQQGRWSEAEEHLLCVEDELSAAQAPPAALEKVRTGLTRLYEAWSAQPADQPGDRHAAN
jgi:hypothetical protein